MKWNEVNSMQNMMKITWPPPPSCCHHRAQPWTKGPGRDTHPTSTRPSYEIRRKPRNLQEKTWKKHEKGLKKRLKDAVFHRILHLIGVLRLFNSLRRAQLAQDLRGLQPPSADSPGPASLATWKRTYRDAFKNALKVIDALKSRKNMEKSTVFFFFKHLKKKTTKAIRRCREAPGIT